MAQIQRLSTALVNQIAAGEVIERPASVVKELLENAIDAHARHVRVEIEQGGRKLIRVTDDGEGLAADDLPLVFASHATSKLASADDLEHIVTMGFRGEALASVGAISHARLISRRRGETAGAEVSVAGGEIGPVTPAGCPEGTIVEVRNLFFNAPVRARFLKKTATEFGRIAEAVTRVALANAAVQFTLVHNGKPTLDLPAVEDLRERLAGLYGRDLVDRLGHVHAVEGDLALDGFIAPPYETRAGTAMQFVFLNGRFIRDRTISHAIREAYRGHIESARRPIVFLYLSLDPMAFDVNVHPTKIEVRFAEPQRVHRTVLATIRRWLINTDTLKPLETAAGAALGGVPPPPTGERIERVREAIADYLSHLPPASPPAGRREGGSPGGPAAARAPGVPKTIPRRKIPADPQRRIDDFLPEEQRGAPALAEGSLFQLFDTYLVAGTADGLLVIDQHALHERVLQERILRRLERAALETQHLLVPVTVDLSPAEFAVFQTVQPTLARLGIDVEAFGGTTVAVRSFPALLERADPATVVHDLVAAAAAGDAPSQEALIESLVNVMACRGAVKAGQRLAEPEMHDLLAEVTGLGDRDTCPHGRPTVLRLTRADLERQFRRS